MRDDISRARRHFHHCPPMVGLTPINVKVNSLLLGFFEESFDSWCICLCTTSTFTEFVYLNILQYLCAGGGRRVLGHLSLQS